MWLEWVQNRQKPGAMECQLQRYVKHSHADHRHRQQRRRAGLVEVEKGADRQNAQCSYHRDGSKERESLHQPSEAGRGVRVDRIPDKLVEFLGVSLQHFIRQPTENEQCYCGD